MLPNPKGRLPLWAAVVGLLTVSYLLNAFVFPLLHTAFATLPEHGILPFLTTAMGVVGIWSAMLGNDERARVCGGVCTGLGLFGTATGLAMMASAKGAGQYDGLNTSFLSTSHGVFMLVLIEFLLIWRMPNGTTGTQALENEFYDE